MKAISMPALLALLCICGLATAQIPQPLTVTPFTDFSYPEVEPTYSYDLVYPVYADVLTANPNNFLPSMTNRYFMSLFGPRHKQTSSSNIGYFDFHKGSDITCDVTYGGVNYNSLNQPDIHCRCEGTVYEIFLPNNPESTETGNYVTVKCFEQFAVSGWGNMYMAYRHLASVTPGLAVGDTVMQGQVLGVMGESGATDQVHLHYSLIRRNTGTQINVNAMRSFDPDNIPHLLNRLTSAEIEQMEFGADTALFRIVLPRTMSSLRALEVTLQGTNYQKVYDFEDMVEHPDCDHNDAVDGLELFAYPFNHGEYLYKRVWDRYEDGQIPWQYPASPDRGTGNFFPYLHMGLAKSPSYAIDLMVRDLPPGWNIEDLNIRLIDIWGYGVEVNGVPQSMDEHFAWAMIDEENNDAEESQGGTMYLSSGDLDLGYNGSMKHQKVGLRFTDLGIPKNASITNAYVQFRSETSNATAVNLTVKAENSSNSAMFAGGLKNITNRPTTSAAVPWSPAAWTIDQMEAAQKTPALTPVVQEMVNRNDWAAASPLTFIIASVANHTGKRESEDYSSVELWDNPYLYVLYNEPPQSLVAPKGNIKMDGGLPHENCMVVSPNPAADGFFSVQLNLETQTETQISLLDMVGRQVAHATVLPSAGEGVYFNVQGLAKGVYMVTAKTESGIITKKIAVN